MKYGNPPRIRRVNAVSSAWPSRVRVQVVRFGRLLNAVHGAQLSIFWNLLEAVARTQCQPSTMRS